MLRRVAFGQWLPDIPMLESPGLREARNTVKRRLGYGPMPSLSALAAFGALDDFAMASLHLVDADGIPHNFAATAEDLWHIETGAWTAVSGVSAPYGTTPSSRWESTTFSSNATGRNPMVLFANFDDPVQVYELGSSAVFADITASVAQPSMATAGAPRARHIATIGQHVHLGYTYDLDDGLVTNRAWWSALQNASSWPVPGTPTAVSVQSDRNVLFGDGGDITAIVGGSTYGVYFRERAVHRADYQGGDLIYNFTRVESQRGCAVPGLAIPFGANVLYFSEDGWFVFHGSGSEPVGEGKINRWFRERFLTDFQHRVSWAIDPDKTLIHIGFVGPGHTDGTPNMVLQYNWSENAWTHREEEHEHLALVVNPGEDLSIDATPATIPDLEEGNWDDVPSATRVIGGFDTSHQLAVSTGAALPARFETGDLELSPGRRSLFRASRPLVTSGTPTVSVAKLLTKGDAVSFGAAKAMRDTGVCRDHAEARYHALRLDLEAGWLGDVLGLDADYGTTGSR